MDPRRELSAVTSPDPLPEPVRPVAEVLRLQEDDLRRGLATARVDLVRSPAITYGVGVAPSAPYLARARARGVATVPRSTGGTGVLHLRHDLLWAIVLPRSDPRVGHDFTRSYDRLGRGVVRGLSTAGVRARWVPAPGLTDDYCTLSARGEVLAAEDRLLGGAAQHVTAGALLHHGSISWEIDRGEVDRLFDLPPGGPSSRLGGVAELGVVDGPAALGATLLRALREEVASGSAP